MSGSRLNGIAVVRDGSSVGRIRAVLPDLRLTDLWSSLVGEIGEDWPQLSVPSANRPTLSPPEVESALESAQVAFLGFPFPRHLPTRMPHLRWAHFAFAGVSNLRQTDWWALQNVTVTTARGSTLVRPIAESVLGAMLMFVRRLDVAAARRPGEPVSARDAFSRMSLLHDKTVAVIGLGGIGAAVARLARAVGMRVVATRRSSATTPEVDVLLGAHDVVRAVAEADVVVLTAMLTRESEGLIDDRVLRAMKHGSVLINVARGELIDEGALVSALTEGRLGGAYLDVWAGDVEGASPSPELLGAPNLVLTPHLSGGGDREAALGEDAFFENYERWIRGEPLVNVVDWSRGY